MSRTETYRYLVSTDMRDGCDKIRAAYYVHEDEFTVFKDESGGIVASFANKHIIGIERETTSIDAEIAHQARRSSGALQ